MAAFLVVFGIFVMTFSESKTETMRMPILCVPATHTVFNATGHQYYEITSFVHLRSAVNETPNLSAKIDRRIRTGWISFMCYTLEPRGQPKASLLHVKIRIVKSEVVETLLYQYTTWTPLKGHYTNNLSTAYHRMLLRTLGAWCRRRTTASSSTNAPSSELDVSISKKS